jgi:hypothetical protein
LTLTFFHANFFTDLFIQWRVSKLSKKTKVSIPERFPGRRLFAFQGGGLKNIEAKDNNIKGEKTHGNEIFKSK